MATSPTCSLSSPRSRLVEFRNADLGSALHALEAQECEATATGTESREAFLNKEADVRAVRAAGDEIREHAWKLADDITEQAVKGEAEPVEEHHQQAEDAPREPRTPLLGPATVKAPKAALGVGSKSTVESLKRPRRVSKNCSPRSPKRHPRSHKTASGPMPGPTQEARPVLPEQPRTVEGPEGDRGDLEAKLAALEQVMAGRDAARALRDPCSHRELERHAWEIATGRPTAAAAAKPVSVTSSMRVRNVDYARLSANPALLSSFKDAMRKAIAAAAGPGIMPEHVELALQAGSVVVQATVTPPRGVSLASVALQLRAAPLEKSVATSVASVDGIHEVSKGPITVAELCLSTPALSASALQEQLVGRAESCAPQRGRLAPRAAGRDSRAHREREARRARRALEDAIVLASRIQLLRAEGARTRRKIHLAMEKKQAASATNHRARRSRGHAAGASPGTAAGRTCDVLLPPSFKGQQASVAGLSPAASPLHPEFVAALLLRAKVARTKAILASCNDLLKDELRTDHTNQSQAAERTPELAAALALRMKMAASKASMMSFNAALREEAEQLNRKLAGLVHQRDALKQRIKSSASRPRFAGPR